MKEAVDYKAGPMGITPVRYLVTDVPFQIPGLTMEIAIKQVSYRNRGQPKTGWVVELGSHAPTQYFSACSRRFEFTDSLRSDPVGDKHMQYVFDSPEVALEEFYAALYWQDPDSFLRQYLVNQISCHGGNTKPSGFTEVKFAEAIAAKEAYDKKWEKVTL